MLKLYGDARSGNCYKVRLLFAQLGIPFDNVEIDVVAGEQRSERFRRLNPNAKTPTVEFEDGTTLWESGAILYRFSVGTPLWPDDPDDAARVLQWMFFEQYSHEPAIAVARFICAYLDQEEEQAERLADLRARGRNALDVMEGHLATHDWFAADRYTIADIALYAYTHCAPEGGFDLEPYPAVRAWLSRVRAVSGHVPIDWAP